MADNVKQHAVPQCYLRQFTNADEKLFVLQLDRGKTFPTGTNKVAYEADCYTIFNEGQRDTSCDEVNSAIERHCGQHLAALRADTPPTDDQWRAVWFLASNLYTRSRRARDEGRDVIDKITRMVEEMAPKLRSLPMPAPLADAFGMGPDWIDDTPESLRQGTKKLYPLGVLVPEMVAEALKRRPIKLIVAPEDSPFITSDDPIACVVGSKVVVPQLGHTFLNQPGLELYFPLTPRLTCHWGPGEHLGRLLVGASKVREVNELMAESAYSQLYSHRRDVLDAFQAGRSSPAE